MTSSLKKIASGLFQNRSGRPEDWTVSGPCHLYLVRTSRAWRSAHIWKKQICLKLQQQKRNAKWFQSLLLPPSYSLNSKNCKGFFNFSGRLVAARGSPTAKNIVSGLLKIRTISGPCHLYWQALKKKLYFSLQWTKIQFQKGWKP